MHIKDKTATLIYILQMAERKNDLSSVVRNDKDIEHLDFAYTDYGNANWYNYEKLPDSTVLTMHVIKQQFHFQMYIPQKCKKIFTHKNIHNGVIYYSYKTQKNLLATKSSRNS